MGLFSTLFGKKKPNVKKLAFRNDATGLIQAAQHKDRELASEALEALRGVTDLGATTQLIEALQSSNRPVRLAAADALGKIGDKRAFEPLLKAARDERRSPQYYLEALDNMDLVDNIDRLISLLKEDQYVLHDWAAKALGKIGETSIGLLLEALSKEEWEQQQSYHAALALKQIGPPAVPSLIEALEHTSGRVRKVVVTALGEIGDAEAVEPLIRALRDKSAEVRTQVIHVLGEIGDERVTKPIMDSLEDDDACVRTCAAGTLLRLGRDEFIDIIIDTLKKNLEDENWQIRDSAASILGWTKSRKAVDPLVRVLKEDRENVVREAALLALLKIVPEEELNDLISRGSD